MKNLKRLSARILFTGFHSLLTTTFAPVAAMPTDTPTHSETAAAEDLNRPSVAEREPSNDGHRPNSTFQLDLSFVPELEITDSSANFDLATAQVTVEFFNFSISAARYDFTWQGAETLPFSGSSTQPWEDLTVVELRKNYTRPLRDNLFLTTSLGVSLSFEEEVDDAYSANAFAAVLWQKSADWSFLFGVAYTWHPEVEVELELLPALGVSYRRDAERGFWGSLGFPETGLGYRFSPRSELSLTAGAQSFVARLADDSPVATAGYSELLRFYTGLFYEHTFGDRFRMKAGPTLGFGGELKVHDHRGVLLESHDLESAPGFSFELSLGF